MDSDLTPTSHDVPSVEAPPKYGSYTTTQHGVWQMLLMTEGFVESFRSLFHDAPKSLPLLYQLVQDMYSLSPMFLTAFALCQFWSGCQQAVEMHFSSKMLKAIERSLKEGVADFPVVTYFVALRLAAALLGSLVSWYSENLMRKLERRITSHFETRLMRARLQDDLAQSKNPGAQSIITATEAWRAFLELVYFVDLVVTVVSQLTLILHLSRGETGGLTFALLCMLQPLWSTMTGDDLWSNVCIVQKNNKDQLKLDALSGLTEPEYRQDVISNNLQKFILDEHRNVSERLGEIANTSVWEIFHRRETPYPMMLTTLLGNLPMVYCAVVALLNPKHTSFASIAIRQESSTLLARQVETILTSSERFRSSMKKLQELYESTKGPNEPENANDLQLEKSAEPEDVTVSGGKGIDFELRNISFSYPGSQASKEALSNINLKIKAGQFVVIVGANGSGKSTLLKLLLRLYQPSATCQTGWQKDGDNSTHGQVLIDSIPASSYSESSLRRSMAVLSQDNLIYPGFSLGENIGLGYTPFLEDEGSLYEAATKAGAKPVVERMKDGMSTVLDPLAEHHQFNVWGKDKDHPLKKVWEELRRPVEVSGGEKQRVVAARTFMKFKSGKVRFLAVDEPSSALDAEGEELLLDNLLKEREGKTIIFVTHRFGKLTKQADLILCMKEGKILESGTHQELIKILDGEYKKLYDIQASPFREDQSPL